MKRDFLLSSVVAEIALPSGSLAKRWKFILKRVNKIQMLNKIALIVLLFISCNMVVWGIDKPQVNSIAKIKNDTLYISLQIINNTDDYYYFPVSQWLFGGDSIRCYGGYNEFRTYCMSKIWYAQKGGIIDNPNEIPVFRDNWNYFPLLMKLETEDTINILIDIYFPQRLRLSDSLDYKLFILLPYINFDVFSELVDLHEISIFDAIIPDKTVSISLTKKSGLKYYNYKYSTSKINKAGNKYIKLTFLNNLLIEADIEREKKRK